VRGEEEDEEDEVELGGGGGEGGRIIQSKRSEQGGLRARPRYAGLGDEVLTCCNAGGGGERKREGERERERERETILGNNVHNGEGVWACLYGKRALFIWQKMPICRRRIGRRRRRWWWWWRRWWWRMRRRRKVYSKQMQWRWPCCRDCKCASFVSRVRGEASSARP